MSDDEPVDDEVEDEVDVEAAAFAEAGGHLEHHLLDKLRGTGVGVEDPNIVGDAGPTDIPPGHDPDTDGLFADPPVPAGPD
jgi:hypothetical protein